MAEETKTAGSLDDTQKIGWYTAYLCLLAEILFLTQLGNVNYMVYAGLSPPKPYCEISNSSRQAAELLRKYPHGRTKDNSSVTELPSPQFQSANIEFHTLCEETKYIKRSISYQMLGIIIGSVVFGQLSDSFGRKWTMVFCLIGTSITDFISSFANGVMTLTLYRGAALFFTGGQAAILLVFMVENLPKRDRMWINTVISWSPNFALFAIMAWTCGEWRILARALGTLAIPGTILCLFISESPRWLVQKGRKEEAFDAIKRIIRFNGGPKMSDAEISTLIDNESVVASKSAGNENFYMYHLFCTAKLTTYTLVFAFSFIATSVLNYGIFFNMSEMPGSIFVNNIVIGCVRWVLNSMMGAVDFRVKSFGRKMLHGMSMGTILFAAIIVFALVQLGKDQEFEKIMRPAVLSVAIMCSFLYVDNNISCNELFPTPIRNSAFSFMQVINRTGVAIAPQLFLLAGFWRSAPYAVMMALCIVDIILYQTFIPETKGRKLDNSMPTPQERFFSSAPKDGAILPYEKTPPRTDKESAL